MLEAGTFIAPRRSGRGQRSIIPKALTYIFVAVAVVVIGFFAVASRPAMTASDPAPREFDRSLVVRGVQLAALGNCIECHTASPGQPFAGGRAIATPFGTIYGTNITPDRETGIGAYTEAAFRRAMRDGIGRDGRHLYPAFPYDHFAKVTDDDLSALYAYLMTRDPVRAHTPKNRVAFPLNIRALVAGWNMLYLDRKPFQPDPSKDAQWNRGAYLAEGLAHCSACHSPRNALGAEKRDAHLAGGQAEGWIAPALNAQSPARVPWNADRLFAYLRSGVDDSHSMAGGPMAPVVHNFARAPEADVRAIAVYIASLMGAPDEAREARARSLAAARAPAPAPEDGTSAPRPQPRDPTLQTGAQLYAGACASCHDRGRELSSAGALDLALSTAVAAREPDNLIRIIQSGLLPPENEPGRWMPAFDNTFTHEQMAQLVQYLRSFADGAPPWRNVAGEVKRARSAGSS